MRLALIVEYDGSRFSGWQRQPGERTAQGVLEQALGTVADHPVEVVCAGRTDAGVHAAGQVVHFDTDAVRPARSWLLGGNANLPPDLALRHVQPVDDEFHARFSAVGRGYRYRILNRGMRSALLRERTWWVHRPLDHDRMQAAADLLLGEHDFSSFRAAACQARHAVRRVTQLRVTRHGDELAVEIEANAFLHHMVRNIVGTLCVVGRGDRDPEWVGELLQLRDRTVAGITAPPQGLSFLRVHYPERFGLVPLA